MDITKTLPRMNTDHLEIAKIAKIAGIAKIEIQNLEPQRTRRNTKAKIGRSGVERMDDWIASLAFHSR
jgi:hypothetical protein